MTRDDVIEAMAKAYDDEFKLWTYGHYDQGDVHGFLVHAVWRDGDQIAQNSQEAPMQAAMARMRAGASIEAALSALEAMGLAIVPKKPTEAMLDAADLSSMIYPSRYPEQEREERREIWRYMLLSSPLRKGDPS
jgi:hypothetical protein